MTGMTALKLVDLAKLRVRFDDDEELLGEIFRVFIAEVPERRTNIRAALAGGDLERLSRLAHSLKGVASTMFAEDLRQAAYDLEVAAKSGEADKVGGLAEAVLGLLDRVADDLGTYLKD